MSAHLFSELGDQRYQVGYQGSCWNVSAQYRDTRIGAFPTREFLIVIGLKGVGALPEIKGSLGGYKPQFSRQPSDGRRLNCYPVRCNSRQGERRPCDQ